MATFGASGALTFGELFGPTASPQPFGNFGTSGSPALRTQAYAVAATTVSFATSTDVKVGDLLTVVYASTVATAWSITATATANSGTQTVAILRLDKTRSDETRDIYIWSGIVTEIPTTLVTVALDGAPTSGLRRLLAQSINPGTLQRWDNTRLDRSSAYDGTTGASAWDMPWGANGTSTQPQWSICASIGDANLRTCNPGDGTARTPFPSASDNFKSLGFGWSTNTLTSAANAVWSLGGSQPKVAVSALYAVAPPSQARGKTVGKGTGRFTVIKTASGRGKSAGKSVGRGYIYTGIFTTSARGKTLAKATGAVRPKTASGRGRSITDSHAASTHKTVSSARGKAAAKAIGGPIVIRPSSARGKIAAAAKGRFTVIRRISSRGKTAAKATGLFTLLRPANGRGKTAAKATGQFTIIKTASGRGNTAGAATGVFTLIKTGTDTGTAASTIPVDGHTLTVVTDDSTATLIEANGATSTVAANLEITYSNITVNGYTSTLIEPNGAANTVYATAELTSTYIASNGAAITVVENTEITFSNIVLSGHTTTLES